MKTRLYNLMFLLCIFALSLSWAGAEETVVFTNFRIKQKSDNIDVDVSENLLELKQDEGGGDRVISFSSQSALNDFEFEGDSRDYWAVANGKAMVVKKPDTSRLPDWRSYVLRLSGVTTNSIDFDWEVSSEHGFDFFVFKIYDSSDNVIKEISKSGTDSGRITESLTPGNYKFEWIYQKDECGSSNEDTVKIGTITLGGSVATGTVIGFFQADKVSVWNNLTVIKTGEVKVEVAASNSDTPGTSAWKTYNSDLQLEGKYLHIKLTFVGEGSMVTGLSVESQEEKNPPTITFVGFKNRYDSNWDLEQLQIKLEDISDISKDSKVEVERVGQTELAHQITLNNDESSPWIFRFNGINLTEAGFYTIKVTAKDTIGNTSSESLTFFLGTDLAIEPGFVIVPSGMKQGFQVSARVGGNRARLSAADLADPNQFSYLGKADFGSFSKQQGSDTILLSTTSGKTGVGTLTVTVAGLTAKARISTGTGMVARVEENEYKGKPVTVYTPGGIKIAELPPQSEVIVWDGLADYGAHAGKQGLPGIYLFKAEGANDVKETLAEEPEKDITISLTATSSKITAQSNSLSGVDVIFASAYVESGNTIWLGTKVVEVPPSGSVTVEWNLAGISGGTAHVRFVTAGGKYAEVQSGLMGFASASTPRAIEQTKKYNEAGQEDDEWIYHKEGQGINEGIYITYSYDPEGRVLKETENNTFIEYSYDGDGRKVRKKIVSSDQEQTIYYVYDKDERLAYQKIVITKDGQVIHEDEKSYPQREDEQ